MKCFDPTLCFITSKTKVYRSWSIAQKSVYLRGIKPAFVFNCGKCIVCRKRRSIELAARCVLHASLYSHNMFLTLTYDEKLPGYHNNFDYSDVQKFKKRLRQFVFRELGSRIEVFNVHEYGKMGKKHWHLIVFGFSFSDKEFFTQKNSHPLFTSRRLSSLWPFGFSTIGDVSEASAMYQAQYMEKDFRNGNVGTKFKSISKHSGLGGPYFLAHYSQLLRLGYIPFSGRKLPLPRYFQRLAHKHWCHFNDQSAFFPTSFRKEGLYRPFAPGDENLEISRLFEVYRSMKEEKILEFEADFDAVISQFISTKDCPDFVLSGSNIAYDHRNKITQEVF